MPLDTSFIQKFAKVVEHLAQDLKGVKTGRAKPALVEDVMADAYQTKMRVKELASITVPDPHTLIISPWDKSVIEAIAKAINSAGLNLNGVVDGDIVRISIPPLTTETREQLVKLVHQKLESAKIMLRQVRAETKKSIEAQKDAGGVGEDQIHQALEEMQKTVDEYEQKLEELSKAKEAELRSF